LKTVAIGNGWYDPLLQYQAYYNYTVYPGNTYDFKPFNQTIEDQMYNALYGPGNCVAMTLDCYARGINEICSAADNFCANEVEELLDNIANRDEYDVREMYDDPFPPTFYVDYLNKASTQAAIGAFQNFSESSNTVGTAFGSTGDDDRQSGTIAAVRALLASSDDITVLQYAGDADYNCNWLGGEAVTDLINPAGWTTAGYTNISTSDSIVHGQVKQAGRFAFARVYESGHEVPFYQPVAALEIFDRAINGKDIATGERKVRAGYRTRGTVKSTYREGNSTIQLATPPVDDTYNTTTNEPNPYNATASDDASRLTRRNALGGDRSKRLFKPVGSK